MMKTYLNPVSATLLLAAITGCASTPQTPIETVRYSQSDIEQDFESFLAFIEATHPDLGYSTDFPELKRLKVKARKDFHASMSLGEAWMAMAQVNPVFHDAHTGLRRPVVAIKAYEEADGFLFPVPVRFDAEGRLRVAPGAAPEGGVAPGEEILSINGRQITSIVSTLSPRMRGESKMLRRLILERYFAEFFWTAYGGADRYRLRLRTSRGVRTVSLSRDNLHETQGAHSPYSYAPLSQGVAYLNVPTFELEREAEFSSFLADAFAGIKASSAKSLIIDLRENGGGARDLSDRLAAYITDKPYSSTSAVKARIVAENVARIPGAEIGDVVSLPFQQMVTPPEENSLRFNGDVYLLVGQLTYSQAIVFAASMQDYEIATIVGEGTEGPANQTGQVQLMALPSTGIEALAPLYIFTRSSGEVSRAGIIPDILIEEDPLEPMVSVTALLEILSN